MLASVCRGSLEGPAGTIRGGRKDLRVGLQHILGRAGGLVKPDGHEFGGMYVPEVGENGEERQSEEPKGELHSRSGCHHHGHPPPVPQGGLPTACGMGAAWTCRSGRQDSRGQPGERGMPQVWRGNDWVLHVRQVNWELQVKLVEWVLQVHR
jgi:hypothetical protein